jgi:hypothetical protein
MFGSIKAKPPQPTAHVVDGHTVLIQGDVGYISSPDGLHYAVHLPTAAVALARPLIDQRRSA